MSAENKKDTKDLENMIKEEAEKGLDYCQKGELKRGIKHLRIAAEHDNIFAITNLGHALKLIGDYKESFKWTLRAAELGQKTAMSNLAIMFRKGQGVEYNVEESVKWGKKLIELGDLDEGYNIIVSAYTYVDKEELRDYKKAFEYALEGSKKIIEREPNPMSGNCCETVVQLALCYGFGRGTDKDEREALKYYDYCCKCNKGIALYNTACIYAFPDDEKLYDIKKAIKYFKLSVRAGYTDGYFQLGKICQRGDEENGIKVNIEKAKFFYAKAIRLGNGEQHYEATIDNLKELSEKDAERVVSGKYSLLID